MPPRSRRAAAAAAAPPADPPLDGCAIAISGKFDGISHNHGTLETLIRTHGGTVTRSVTKATTHVVCSEFDFNAGTTKIAAGKAKDLPMVDPQWVIDIDEQTKKLSVDDYLWDAPKKANGTKAKAAANGTAKKRTAAAKKADEEEEEEVDEEEEQPKAKKAKATKAAAPKAAAPKAAAPKATKATKGKGKAAVKDEPEEEPEEEKIVAEGQFIKKKGIVIPLDEHCPHANYEVFIDPDSGMIYDAALNQTNSSNNNNKFYRVQVSCLRKVKSAKLLFLTLPTDSIQPQRQELPYLDAMGSCRRVWRKRYTRWRHSPRGYQAL
jgi:poly [ADP-ribose] polymerase